MTEAKKKPRIIICMNDGAMDHVTCDDPDGVDVFLLNRDTYGEQPDSKELELKLPDGSSVKRRMQCVRVPMTSAKPSLVDQIERVAGPEAKQIKMAIVVDDSNLRGGDHITNISEEFGKIMRERYGINANILGILKPKGDK